MKSIKPALLALTLCLAALLAGSAALAETTQASIAFTEGTLEFGTLNPESGIDSLDIDFGTHTLPVGADVFAAEDGRHTLTVLDARSAGKAGDWRVIASVTPFVSDDPAASFHATIILKNPSVTTGLTSPSSLNLFSAGAEVEVVSAAAGLNNGTYLTTWNALDGSTPENGNVLLSITEAAAASVIYAVPFEATVTWTLVNGPA